MPKSLCRVERKPCKTSLLAVVAAASLVIGCVDLTEPWKQHGKLGTGGIPGGGVGGSGEVDIPVDAETGGPMDAAGGSGGWLDSGSAGAGGSLDLGGGGGSIDVAIASDTDESVDAPNGAGGRTDAPRAGGAGGGIDAPMGGAGGPATGGKSGGSGGKASGGATGAGGAKTDGTSGGTGGAATPDAGVDVPPDLPTDLPTDPADASTLAIGLMAYYPCESASGTTLLDMSGNGRNGTLSIGVPPDGGTAPSGSAYKFDAGKVGNALVLSRAGYGYVSLPLAVFAGITDMTIAVWVNTTTSLTRQRIFDVGVNASSYQPPPMGTKYMNLTPRNTDGKLRFSITTNGFISEESLNATSPSTGEWKHVAIVLTGGMGTLYIDGGATVVTDPTAQQPASLGAIDYAYLGKSQFGQDPYFDGMIDEVRVYNRALSATEITALYQFTEP